MTEIIAIILVSWAIVGLMVWLGHFVGGSPKEASKSEPAEPKPAQQEAIAPAPEQAR